MQNPYHNQMYAQYKYRIKEIYDSLTPAARKVLVQTIKNECGIVNDTTFWRWQQITKVTDQNERNHTDIPAKALIVMAEVLEIPVAALINDVDQYFAVVRPKHMDPKPFQESVKKKFNLMVPANVPA